MARALPAPSDNRRLADVAAQRYLADVAGTDRWIASRAYAHSGLTFDLNHENRGYGVERLPAELTINGITETPALRLHPYDATISAWAPWVYGGSFSIAGSGNDPIVDQSNPLHGRYGDSDYVLLSNRNRALTFGAAKFYEADDVNLINFGTADAFIEMGFMPGSPGIIIGKQYGLDPRWLLYITGGLQLALFMLVGGVSRQIVSATLSTDTRYLVHVIVKRNGYGQIYLNNATSGAAVDVTAVAASLDNAVAATLGAYSNGTSASTATLDTLSVYLRDGWLDSHLQPDVVADRCARYWGFDADVNASASANVPEVYTRASAGFAQKEEYGCVAKFYYCAAGWPRVDSLRTDDDEHRNDFDYSEDLTQWTAEGTTTVDTSPGVYFRGREVQGLVGGAVDEAHGFSQSITVAAETHLPQFCVKAGDKSGIRIESEDENGDPIVAQYDVSTGALGLTSGVGMSVKIKSAGWKLLDGDDSGWYDVMVSFPGGSGAHDVKIFAVADADVDDKVYTGDGATIDLYVSECRHDRAPSNGLKKWSSIYVKTVGVARSVGGLVRGYRAEQQDQNLASNSKDHESWATTGSPTVSPNSQTSPTGDQDADRITGLTSADTVYQSFSGTPSGPGMVGQWIRRVSTSGHLRIGNAYSGTLGEWDVDLSLMPDSWVRLTAESPFVTVNTAFSFASGAGNGGLRLSAFAPDTVDVDVWNSQVEDRGGYPSSDIITAGGAGTRVTDDLYFKADDGVIIDGHGSIAVDFYVPDYTPTSLSKYLASINDGTTANRIELIITQQTRLYIAKSGIGQADLTPVISCFDGLAHSIAAGWKSDLFRLTKDNLQIGIDVSGDVPLTLSRLKVASGTYAAPFGGLLRRLRAYSIRRLRAYSK